MVRPCHVANGSKRTQDRGAGSQRSPSLWGDNMTAYNIVRFRVKPGYEQKFIDAHKTARPNFKGFVEGAMVKTGEQTYCFVAKWTNFKRIADARPGMIAMLNS